MEPAFVSEQYIHEVLARIEREAREQAEPWIAKLAELEAMKPPKPIVIGADWTPPPRPVDYEPAWREYHRHLGWMQGCRGLPSWAWGLNLADIATRLIDSAYPGLRDGTLTLRRSTIDGAAVDDMREFGVGFEVDGKRVHPSRVIVHRRALRADDAVATEPADVERYRNALVEVKDLAMHAQTGTVRKQIVTHVHEVLGTGAAPNSAADAARAHRGESTE